jgi:hypothetical protein
MLDISWVISFGIIITLFVAPDFLLRLRQQLLYVLEERRERRRSEKKLRLEGKVEEREGRGDGVRDIVLQHQSLLIR